MTLRSAHLLTACLLLLFLAAHLANHMMAIAGTGRHIAVMDALRAIYRHALVEPALPGAFEAFEVPARYLATYGVTK